MKTKIIVHRAEEGGYWAEVTSIPGCVTQGETIEELVINLKEAVDGCLSVMAETMKSILDQDLQEKVFENRRRKKAVFSYPTERMAA